MTLGKLFSAVKESFRDKRRDQFCSDLQAIGVKASLLAKNDDREKEPRQHSLGLIGISNSPIAWANIISYSSGASADSAGTNTEVHFAVLDPSLRGQSQSINLKKLTLRNTRIRTFPLFGQPTEIWWKGNDSGLGTIRQLNEASELNRSLLDLNQEFMLTAHSVYESFWLIHPIGLADKRRKRNGVQSYIDRGTWNAIEAIAHTLLRIRVPDEFRIG
jgi:hypothetical protein